MTEDWAWMRDEAGRSQTPPYGGDHSHVATVLVVEDNPGTLETTTLQLRLAGLRVHQAATGAAALEATAEHHFDLLLVDWLLPDQSGLELIDTLRARRIDVPWVLVSAFMDYDVALEAGHRNAVAVVPMTLGVDIADVVIRAIRKTRADEASGWPALPLARRLRSPRSAAEHGAWAILRACDAAADLHSIAVWGPIAATSYSQLRDLFHRIGIPPERARDFTRIFRALIKGKGRVGAVHCELIVGDSRTLADLLTRGGLHGLDRSDVLSVDQFLAAQQLIEHDHPLLQDIRMLIADL